MERKRRKFRNTVEFFALYVEKHVESVYNSLYCGAVRMKLCKWVGAGAEAGGGAVKKFKKGLTAEFGSGRMLRNKKAGTVPRPHPRPVPKGL